MVVLVAGIGDLVLASKSLKAIRKGWPHAEIHLLTSSEAAPVARNYSFLDRVWSFPIREMRTNKAYVVDMGKISLDLRKIRFDCIINLYEVASWLGALKMGLLFLVVKGKEKIGHGGKFFRLFLDKEVPARRFKDCHFAEAMMEISFLAGAREDGKDIEVFWDQESEERWSPLFPKEAERLHQIRVGINPGGDRKNRRWDAGKYAMVADCLVERFNAKIILLGGPGEEDIARGIERNMRNTAISLAGKLSVSDLAYVVSELDLLVTNDSGPMHIAAARKTPTVAIFGPEDPKLFHPYMSPEKYVVIYKNLDCQPCKKNRCSSLSCLRDISANEVFEAARKLLALN